MNVRLKKVTCHAFRGVSQELLIELDSRSLAVFGDNGTGKSTLADAIEWTTSGRIEFLSHEGREHAIRHIGASTADTTYVELETTGGKYRQEYPASTPALVTQDTLLLRGRTLSDFVNKSKGEKWKALAEILGLEDVEGLRLDLQRVRNDLKSKADDADVASVVSAKALESQGMKKPYLGDVFAEAVNVCQRSGIPPAKSTEELLDQSWLENLKGVTAEAQRHTRLEKLRSELEPNATPQQDARSAVDRWQEALALPSTEAARLRLFRAAVPLVNKHETRTCPLCGQTVDANDLSSSIEAVVAEIGAAAKEFEESEREIRQLIDELHSGSRHRLKVRALALADGVALNAPPVVPADLVAAVDERRTLKLSAVTDVADLFREWDQAARLELSKTFIAPEFQEVVQLGVLVGHARDFVARNETAQVTRRAAKQADLVFAAYQKHERDYFAKVLAGISEVAAEFYGALHPGEKLEDVTVEPWTSKGIELSVRFHGQKQRPPHGVLSESHLNSLAIVLFLAMAESFNQDTRFLVLDDVVNSFDIEHRGALADLLTKRFEDWQLIVLTHDQQFYQQLVRKAPKWKKMELTSWTFEGGPRLAGYTTGALLEKSAVALAAGDLIGAATKARRALEEALQELCEALAFPLPFRRGAKNDRREIGELTSGVRRGLGAASKAKLDQIGALLTDLEADVAATLNVEAHASLGRAAIAEVKASIDRIEAFTQAWTCDSCLTRVWEQGSAQACQCRCGKTTFPPPAPVKPKK